MEEAGAEVKKEELMSLFHVNTLVQAQDMVGGGTPKGHRP